MIDLELGVKPGVVYVKKQLTLGKKIRNFCVISQLENSRQHEEILVVSS